VASGHRRRSLGADLLANLAGGGWGALVQLVCIPVYLHRLGAEGYGLVAFASTLFLTTKALDLGASHAMNREMARAGTGAPGAPARRFALRLERAYLAIGVMIALVLLALAPAIATRWISPGQMPAADVVTAIRLIALLVLVQWPLSLYQGALMGRHRAIEMNVVAVAMSTLSGAGAVTLVILVRPSVHLLLGWLVGVGLLHTAIAAMLHHRALPQAGATDAGDGGVSIVASVAQAGVLTVTALLLMQADKLAASRALVLADYGGYMLAVAVASGIAVLTAPVFNSVFPRLSALHAARDVAGVRVTMGVAAQVLGVLVFPVAAALALLAEDLLRLWTRDAAAAAAAAPALRALAVGTALYGLLQLSQGLQMAAGRTARGVALNLGAVALAFAAGNAGPVRAWLGAAGIAWAWATLLLVHVGASAWLVHRPLAGGAAHWLLGDVGRPLLAVAIASLLLSLTPALDAPLEPAGALARLAGVWLVLALAALAAAPAVSAFARERLRRSRQPAPTS
jgi:O-antigen/teichoic acid export membrane protein